MGFQAGEARAEAHFWARKKKTRKKKKKKQKKNRKKKKRTSMPNLQGGNVKSDPCPIIVTPPRTPSRLNVSIKQVLIRLQNKF